MSVRQSVRNVMREMWMFLLLLNIYKSSLYIFCALFVVNGSKDLNLIFVLRYFWMFSFLYLYLNLFLLRYTIYLTTISNPFPLSWLIKTFVKFLMNSFPWSFLKPRFRVFKTPQKIKKNITLVFLQSLFFFINPILK